MTVLIGALDWADAVAALGTGVEGASVTGVLVLGWLVIAALVEGTGVVGRSVSRSTLVGDAVAAIGAWVPLERSIGARVGGDGEEVTGGEVSGGEVSGWKENM